MPAYDETIDNPHSERIRRVGDLKERRSRIRHGRFLVEGPQGVREAVSCRPDAVLDIYATVADPQTEPGKEGLAGPSAAASCVPPSPSAGPAVSGPRRAADLPATLGGTVIPIVRQALEVGGIYVHYVTDRVMKAMSKDSQGILAVCRTDAMTGPEGSGWTQAAGPVAAFWQVRDPGNAGTVIRTADAAGCRCVVFVDDCVDPFNPKVVRSTAGSLFHIPVLSMGTEDFMSWCRSSGFDLVAADVYGTEGRSPTPLPDFLEGPSTGGRATAVLFGNEARGLPADILTRTDRIVSIPIYGKAESLNLATSAAVLLYSMAMSGGFHVESY